MNSLLMFVINVQPPRVGDCMLQTCAELYCIGRVVMGIDQRSLVPRPKQGGYPGSDRAKSVHPAVLRQIVEINACPCADYRVSAGTGRIGKAKPWRKCLAVIMRDAVRQAESGWKIERRHGLHCGIVALVAAIGVEEPKCSVIAQAVIHREVR